MCVWGGYGNMGGAVGDRYIPKGSHKEEIKVLPYLFFDIHVKSIFSTDIEQILITKYT